MRKLRHALLFIGTALVAGEAWTLPVELPLVGDWDGDSNTEVGLFVAAPEPFFLLCEARPGPVPCKKHFVPRILRGFSPTALDWDGDGRDEPLLFAPRLPWLVLFDFSSKAATLRVVEVREARGEEWELLLVGDWDGDGRADLALSRPGSGRLKVLTDPFGARTRVTTLTFLGIKPDWQPLVGDWDGDGRDSIGFFVPTTRTVLVRDSLTSGPPERAIALPAALVNLTALRGEQGSHGLIFWFYSQSERFFATYDPDNGLGQPAVNVIVPTDPDG